MSHVAGVQLVSETITVNGVTTDLTTGDRQRKKSDEALLAAWGMMDEVLTQLESSDAEPSPLPSMIGRGFIARVRNLPDAKLLGMLSLAACYNQPKES